MRLLITGATGYIGDRLVHHALFSGHEVIAASRQPPCSQIQWFPFDLSSASVIKLPDGIDAVFHLAATTSGSHEPDLELTTTKNLIQSAVKIGAKFIFVSSQTAREDAPTVYGRTKWQIERLVLDSGGWVVRPGQVYGGYEQALFGILVKVVRNLPVIPAFFPSPKIQPVHVDDLVVTLLSCAESNCIPSSVLCVGASKLVSFTDFLRIIAKNRVRRYRMPIPIPVFLVRFTSFVLGKHLRTKFGLDRLISLFDLPAMETERDLQLLGMSLRSLPSGMTRSGNGQRRSLIHEGQALLKYVLKTKPSPILVRRYVRSIESIGGGEPMYLPEFVLCTPVAIALLDDSAMSTMPFGADFAWRLNTAVMLAEASFQGARRFLAIGQNTGFFTNILRIAYAVTLELCWRILRFISEPFLKPVLRHLRSPR